MGKIFLNQWNAANYENRLECARLLEMEADEVEKLMAERLVAFDEQEEKKRS